MDKKLNLVWFRRDLRVRDNAIVSLATVQGPCLFFFVLDEWFLRQSSVASKRVQFLFESLQGLDAELRRLGSQLHIFVGESREVLRQLGRESGGARVDPDAVVRARRAGGVRAQARRGGAGVLRKTGVGSVGRN